MAFLKKLGGALKAPIKAAGKLPGMGALQKATPGGGMMGKKLGIGPTPNPSPNAGPMGNMAAGMLGAGNAIASRFGGMQKPQSPVALPPPQMDQGMAMPTGQPQPFMPQEPQMSVPEPPQQMGPPPAPVNWGGSITPGTRIPPPQPQMQRPDPRQSMFARKNPNRQMM